MHKISQTWIHCTQFVSMNLENTSSLQRWPVLNAVSHRCLSGRYDIILVESVIQHFDLFSIIILNIMVCNLEQTQTFQFLLVELDFNSHFVASYEKSPISTLTLGIPNKLESLSLELESLCFLRAGQHVKIQLYLPGINAMYDKVYHTSPWYKQGNKTLLLGNV